MRTRPVIPCIWCDDDARGAADLYVAAFPDSRITSETPFMMGFELNGRPLLAMNGGPRYRPNPRLSLFGFFDSEEEVNRAHGILVEGGSELMPLGAYPWSPRYAWIEDRFGVSWQLMVRGQGDDVDAVVPCLMFTGETYGRAREAMERYARIFPDSGPGSITANADGTVLHGRFRVNGADVIAMDSGGAHAFDFTEGMSLFVFADTQDEIDRYWDGLIADGGEESRCGWLKDPYGVSWQIIPSVLPVLMKDPERAPRVAEAFLQMSRFDLDAILKA